MHRIALLVLAWLVPVIAAHAAAPLPTPAHCKIAVLDMKSSGLSDAERAMPTVLTAALAAELSTVTMCQVATTADFKAMLDFVAQKAACGGDTDACLAEIGNALGVDEIVTGSVAHLGDRYVIDVQRISIKTGAMLARDEETSLAVPERARRAVRNGARVIYGAATDDGRALRPVLAWSGGVAVGAGVVTAAVAGTLAILDDNVLGDATATRATKETARAHETTDLIVACVGVGVAAVGAVLLVFAGME